MSSKQKRSKEWGYEVEIQTITALAPIFPGIKRTGSVAYKKAAADLASESPLDLEPILIVTTKDKGPGNPLLVTLTADDLKRMLDNWSSFGYPVRVQCKGRAKTWIGGLWRGLRDAVKAEKKAQAATG